MQLRFVTNARHVNRQAIRNSYMCQTIVLLTTTPIITAVFMFVYHVNIVCGG